MRLTSAYAGLDAHQKTILSDDFGMGVPMLWLEDRLSLEEIVDGRYFLQFVGASVGATAGEDLPDLHVCEEFVAFARQDRSYSQRSKRGIFEYRAPGVGDDGAAKLLFVAVVQLSYFIVVRHQGDLCRTSATNVISCTIGESKKRIAKGPAECVAALGKHFARNIFRHRPCIATDYAIKAEFFAHSTLRIADSSGSRLHLRAAKSKLSSRPLQSEVEGGIPLHKRAHSTGWGLEKFVARAAPLVAT